MLAVCSLHQQHLKSFSLSIFRCPHLEWPWPMTKGILRMMTLTRECLKTRASQKTQRMKTRLQELAGNMSQNITLTTPSWMVSALEFVYISFTMKNCNIKKADGMERHCRQCNSYNHLTKYQLQSEFWCFVYRLLLILAHVTSHIQS